MKKNRLLLTAAICLSLSLFMNGCDAGKSVKNAEPVATKVQGKTMGTFYAVNVVGGYKGGEKALTELAENCFKKICDEISTFDKNAELAKYSGYCLSGQKNR